MVEDSILQNCPS